MLQTHEIKHRVQTQPAWTIRAILALYAFQTDEEQALRHTKVQNKVGFNGVDAGILSSFAEQIIAGHNLTLKQLRTAQRKIGKYAKQLHRIACTREGI